ncbi:MAG TPA: HIT family protein [Candidatus Paceibacterota bacterium]|jgi:histidine triad (HIT) family protein|nr:HIT family protein [Candidatus Paceibacterota bacterium]
MNECIFCKIVAGDIPSYRVAENEFAYAFLDIHPANPGHTLVIPKRHAVTVFDTTAEEWRAISDLVRDLSIAVEKATDAEGLNIKMNNRVHGGQEVMHAHVHVVPRYKGDGVVKPIVQKPGYDSGKAEEVQQKIIAALQ